MGHRDPGAGAPSMRAECGRCLTNLVSVRQGQEQVGMPLASGTGHMSAGVGLSCYAYASVLPTSQLLSASSQVSKRSRPVRQRS